MRMLLLQAFPATHFAQRLEGEGEEVVAGLSIEAASTLLSRSLTTCLLWSDVTGGLLSITFLDRFKHSGGCATSNLQSWALSVFFNVFNNKKMIFCLFYQVNLTGSGLFK